MSNSTYIKRDPYFDHPPTCKPRVGNYSTPVGKSRMLTPNETTAAEFLFSISIEPWLVRIYNGKFSFLQHDHVIMAPAGHIYFPPDYFRTDYICSVDIEDEALFIHELVHTWQYQRGMWVAARGLASWLVSYDYELDANKNIKDYGMEEMANLIADYYLLKKYNSSVFLLNKKYVKDPVEELMPIYKSILLKNSGFPFIGW